MSIHLDTVPALSDRQTYRQTERIGKKNIALYMHCMLTRDKNT